MGHPTLRKKCSKLSSKAILSQPIQTLIDQMIGTINSRGAVALAAPQVGHTLRLFVIDKEFADGNSVVINPRIVTNTSQKYYDIEKCESIPGLSGLVSRASCIDVEFTNRKGELINKTLEALQSRIFLHEYDHLDGILYTSRLDSIDDIFHDNELLRQIEEDGEILGRITVPPAQSTMSFAIEPKRQTSWW